MSYKQLTRTINDDGTITWGYLRNGHFVPLDEWNKPDPTPRRQLIEEKIEMQDGSFATTLTWQTIPAEPPAEPAPAEPSASPPAAEGPDAV